MKSLNLSRCALSVCVAGTLLAGCGGPQTQSWNAAPPLQSTAKSSELMKRAASGSFTASYAGTYGTQCGAGICVSYYHGTGNGTFIHHSRLKGKLVSDLSGCGGPFTFRSRKHPGDAFTVYVSFSNLTCEGTGNYTVSGGKGKFSDASGSGTVSFSLNSSNYSFTSSWSGTLDF